MQALLEALQDTAAAGDTPAPAGAHQAGAAAAGARSEAQQQQQAAGAADVALCVAAAGRRVRESEAAIGSVAGALQEVANHLGAFGGMDAAGAAASGAAAGAAAGPSGLSGASESVPGLSTGAFLTGGAAAPAAGISPETPAADRASATAGTTASAGPAAIPGLGTAGGSTSVWDLFLGPTAAACAPQALAAPAVSAAAEPSDAAFSAPLLREQLRQLQLAGVLAPPPGAAGGTLQQAAFAAGCGEGAATVDGASGSSGSGWDAPGPYRSSRCQRRI